MEKAEKKRGVDRKEKRDKEEGGGGEAQLREKSLRNRSFSTYGFYIYAIYQREQSK